MIKPNKLRAYAVAAQFGDAQQGFLACCSYVANDPAVATAQVVSLIMSETKTALPLIAVNATELPVEWLRGALEMIYTGEKDADVNDKPKVVQLVSDNRRTHFAEPSEVNAVKLGHDRQCMVSVGGSCNCGFTGPACPPPTRQNDLKPSPFPQNLSGKTSHLLSCPRAWGGWGTCRCGAEHGDGAA